MVIYVWRDDNMAGDIPPDMSAGELRGFPSLKFRVWPGHAVTLPQSG